MLALQTVTHFVTQNVTHEGAMNYLLHRHGRYYYNRRVPREVRAYDPRDIIRIALKTDSRKEAVRLACLQNDKIELYWKELIDSGQKYTHRHFQETIEQARTFGFSYIQVHQLAQGPLDEVLKRLEFLEGKQNSTKAVASVLGTVKQPEILIDEALNQFWNLAKDKTLNKSPNQIRKWKHPRIRAVKNFIACNGNKSITALTREDTLRFRDWWIRRIEEQDLGANGANKNFFQLKGILKTVSENTGLEVDIDKLFKDLALPEDHDNRRLPFKTEYLKTTLLNPDNLKGLPDQAKWVLYAFAETGAGLSELLGLLPEDIRLNCDIPHIAIVPRKRKKLKTRYRKREIPLVGYALDAFTACPSGFTEYWDRPDALSSVLGNYLRSKGLLPTEHHTVYSLRHSFQDRLLGVNAPDRVQADLMGHKFNRPAYGDGSTLKQKLDWLNRITLSAEISSMAKACDVLLSLNLS